MIITKMHLSRRTVLRGLGASLALAAARQHGAGADGAQPGPPRRRCAGSACSMCPTACPCRTGIRRLSEGPLEDASADLRR